MSLEGKMAADKLLRGKINGLDVIYTDTYRIAVANGYEGTVEEWLAQLPTRMEMDEAVAQTENYCKQTAADSAVAVDAKSAALNAAEKAETKVESLIERNNKQPVSLWVGTQAEYDAITDKDESRLYLISDDTDIGDLVKKHSAPYNLLDNSDFTNAVNQRGETSLTYGGLSGYVYFIDRWIFNHSSECNINISDAGIGTESDIVTLSQRLKKSNLTYGNDYTLTTYYADGSVSVDTQNYQYNAPINWANSDYVEVAVGVNRGKTIAHVALYEGIYTAENVPAYRPKGYAAELAECQRYYRNINKGILNGYITGSGTYLWVSLPFTMRKVPDVTCYGTQFTLRTVEGYYKGENIGAPTNCAYDGGNYGILSMQWNNGDTLVKDTVTVNGVDVLANNNTPAALEIRFGGGIVMSADY